MCRCANYKDQFHLIRFPYKLVSTVIAQSPPQHRTVTMRTPMMSTLTLTTERVWRPRIRVLTAPPPPVYRYWSGSVCRRVSHFHPPTVETDRISTNAFVSSPAPRPPQLR